MKRSEMLVLMYGKFTKEHIIKKASVHDALNKLLNYMIEQGMQPPPVRVMKDSLVLNKRTCEWEQGKISCTVNEWEPEVTETEPDVTKE